MLLLLFFKKKKLDERDHSLDFSMRVEFQEIEKEWKIRVLINTSHELNEEIQDYKIM